MNSICGNCGSINSKVNKTDGGRSVVLFLLLCLCFVVPGLLYWGFAKKERKFVVCSGCGAENEFYDLKTPKGVKLFKEYHPDEKLPSEKSKSWHGLW